MISNNTYNAWLKERPKRNNISLPQDTKVYTLSYCTIQPATLIYLSCFAKRHKCKQS